MTPQIAMVLAILLMAVALFVTERLRMDVVALLVLGGLALTGLVTPAEALSGFSSPAVVTVWAMFIISGGLSKTGVDKVVGRQVMRLAGQGEVRLILVIMLTAGVMSAFMNNVGVAAMMLPVVMDIAHQTKRPPSKLLMPLAFGSLLGGLTTLIGTPPNILVSDALRDYGLRPFQLFDFTLIGLSLMLAGVAFIALIGRFLLPDRDPVRESAAAGDKDLGESYDLHQRVFVIHLPGSSPLAGKTLADSRLGSALRLNVLAIIRNGQTHPAPGPAVVLRPGDRLMVQGRQDLLAALRGRQHLVIEDDNGGTQTFIADKIDIAEVQLSPNSSLAGQTLYESGLRSRIGINVLAIRRNGQVHHTNLPAVRLQSGDILLVQGPRAHLETLPDSADFDDLRYISESETVERYQLRERMMALRIPQESILSGRTLRESRLGDALDLNVLGIIRQGDTHWLPDPEETLQPEDILLVEGTPEALSILRGMQDLEIESQTLSDLSTLESEHVGLSEMVLSPYTTLVGKTLRQLNFREKYGLNVLAIWREGRAYRSNLRDIALRFGDAVLLFGPRQKLRILGSEPDFLVLTTGVQEAPRLDKAPLSTLIMVVILLPVLVGWLPISIAAVIGATLMVLSRCLTMEEAYRFIEWPAVFLIAGMLPLGIAMEQTGAALFLADGVISLVGGLGLHAVIASIFILTSLATQVIPTAALVVLMAPIAFNTATDLSISPYTLMMTVAMAASASFSSPVSHPANVLIMGPGGYRFADYLKMGLPLTLVMLVLVVALMPIFWPP